MTLRRLLSRLKIEPGLGNRANVHRLDTTALGYYVPDNAPRIIRKEA